MELELLLVVWALRLLRDCTMRCDDLHMDATLVSFFLFAQLIVAFGIIRSLSTFKHTAAYASY
jgi:hypothetical protein